MSVLQELIKAGEMKIAREEMRIKRIQAQDAERAQRRKEIVCQMYPQIAEYIQFTEFPIMRNARWELKVNAPQCELFYLYVIIHNGGLIKVGPDDEVSAFWNPDLFATNDLEIALALAHKAWLAENSTEPVYTDAEESA